MTFHRFLPLLKYWIFLFFATGFSVIQAQSPPAVTSVTSSFDFPLPPDNNLFEIGAGISVNRRWPLPFSRVLFAGLAGHYHLARMQHASLGDLGTLSLFSAELIPALRLPVRNAMDVYASPGIGYYYASENGESSSWATNLVWSGRTGIGFRITDFIAITVQSEYRNYRRLHHLLGFGIGMDFFFRDIQ